MAKKLTIPIKIHAPIPTIKIKYHIAVQADGNLQRFEDKSVLVVEKNIQRSILNAEIFERYRFLRGFMLNTHPSQLAI